MPTSPRGQRNQFGRHAASRAGAAAPTLGPPPTVEAPATAEGDIEVLDGELVDGESDGQEPAPRRTGRHRDPLTRTHTFRAPAPDESTPVPGTPLVNTGMAVSSWVKWLRSRGAEAGPGGPARVRSTPPPAAPSASAPSASGPPASEPVTASGPVAAPPPRTTIDVRGDQVAESTSTAPTSRMDLGSPPPISPHTLKGAQEPPTGWRSYLRPGFLVVGALFIQMAFIGAYVGAWHAPVAHGLPVAMVTSPSVEQFQAAFEQKSDAVSVETYTSRSDAFEALQDQDVYAVLVAGKGGQTELHLASAGGGAAAESLAQNYGRVATLTGLPLQVYDDVPLPPTDNRGITPFYLVVGWVVGGYLVSTLLSFIAGSTPEPRRGRIRILSLLAYAIASGIGGAVIVGPMLDIWHQNLVALATLGILVVFGASATAAALSALLGSVGIGLTILLLVVLGNPGSGGPFAPEMLPEPFRNLHNWILTGAATTATRAIVYFDGHGDTDAYLVLLTWCALGSVLYLFAITLRGLRPAHVVRSLGALRKRRTT